MPRLCIGTSGYEYDDWLGRFYPTELAPPDRLRYYADRFSTVELNTTRGHRYSGSYGPQALSGAARRIRRHLDDGLDVYAYFNNDVGGHAIGNALDLARHVGG